MKVAITGGSGLIGRALSDALVDSGHQPVWTSRSPDRLKSVPSGVTVRAWDGRSAGPLVAVLDEVDAVVHLAGENIGSGRWTGARKARIKDSRTRSTAALAAAFRAASVKPRVLVQGSAVGYYGPRGDEPVTEESGAGDDFLAGVCEKWEDASAAVQELGVRRVVARTGVVLSTEGGALPKMLLPFRLFAGGPVGTGRQVVPWVHIEDEARALLQLLEDEAAEGPFNLTAPEAVTNRELAKIVGRVLGRPAFLPTPALPLRIGLGEMSTLVLDGQRAVPEKLEASGFTFLFPELEGALRHLLQ